MSGRCWRCSRYRPIRTLFVTSHRYECRNRSDCSEVVRVVEVAVKHAADEARQLAIAETVAKICGAAEEIGSTK